MDLIYSMRRKPFKSEPPHLENLVDPEVPRPICTISSANIIAFSSSTELSDWEGETWGGYVYVCDLDTPWESHKVASTIHPVSVLEWDTEGKQLLIATTVGEVSIYTQKDYLLNEWTCQSTVNFAGEHIVKAAFFHDGRKLVLTDKKPDAPMSEKIQVLRGTPTLGGFGGVATSGVVILTASGVIGAIVDGTYVTESLRSHRDYITTAAITTTHTGQIGVAAVCGRRVRCVTATLQRPPRPPLLQPLPAICLPDIPTSISWCLRDETDCLLISGKTVSLWKLSEKAFPIHKLLSKGPVAGSTTPGGGQKPADAFNATVWQQTSTWQIEKTSRTVTASSRLPSTISGVLAAPKTIYLLPSREKAQVISAPVVTHGPNGEVIAAGATPPKKPKYGPGSVNTGSPCAVVSSVDISWLGGVVVALDSHSQLHVYKVPQPWADVPTPMSVQHASALLEYSIVSGYNSLDLLMTLKPQNIEALYERITETFQRQPSTFQQYYYQTWLKLRTSLCRLLPAGQQSASSLVCLQSLYSVWAGCAAALRIDERADAAALIDDQNHHDIEKTLLSLEAKTELPCDSLALQAIRRPLQHALEVAVTALATVSQQQLPNTNGYDLANGDPTAINLLRKLMIFIRACGRTGEPLQRPLARLAACKTPSQDLIEECANVAAQMSLPRVWESLPRCNVSAPHGQSWPFYLEYGLEPEELRYNPEPPPQYDVSPSLAMDSIRYMYLGGLSRWRQCGRCGTKAFAPAHPSRHALQRAYDARFLPTCRCGGKWTLYSNV